MSQGQRVVAGLVVTLLIAVIVVVAVVQPFSSNTPSAQPHVTNFYAAPAHVPARPGALIRSEAVYGGVPAGAQAWRILYTTTRANGVPAIASALVIAKTDLNGDAHPVIAWAHGTSGFARPCAPSEQMDATVFGGIPDVAKVVAKGWVVVATDYTGLGTKGPQPYLVGEGEGRSVLDAVRAAHHFDQVSLADKTVVWGHSQGGGAALWAGILAPRYAPDARVIGVAGIAPTSDLPGLATTLGTTSGGVVFASYLMASYAAAYPDVKLDHYLRPAAQGPMQDLAKHCLIDTSALVAIGQTLPAGQPFYAADPTTGPLGTHLAANNPTGVIDVPLFIGQGKDDVLVLPKYQDAYVAQRCATDPAGTVDYRTYKGQGHISVIATGSKLPGDLVAWTSDRFDGKTATSTCA